jgi:hypothetical protein
MRVIRLYPPENEAVRNALADLAQVAREFLEREHELELRASNEFIFVNSTRLRLDLDNYASFSQILSRSILLKHPFCLSTCCTPRATP